MERVLVDSSVVVSLTYDEDTLTLDVEFRSGRIYRYFMLPRAIYDALVAAGSVGAYFNTKVRQRYPHRKISEARSER